MHGLTRVRQFTISEGHLIVRPDQMDRRFKGLSCSCKICCGDTWSRRGCNISSVKMGSGYQGKIHWFKKFGKATEVVFGIF